MKDVYHAQILMIHMLWLLVLSFYEWGLTKPTKPSRKINLVQLVYPFPTSASPIFDKDSAMQTSLQKRQMLGPINNFS
jgi:hypothetical protein